ncbi:acetolactate synthase large subunit [Mycobacterium sp. 134]|uniref:acetolactate synthase large subunit n=1 Tax=Mycobacterium sp. 134 TaxID=3400425 RepID=UPI003AAC84CF
MRTGAQAVIDALLNGGVDVCFANPGTSEMHFVAALDEAPQMRAILCLFEGVATGAADGYARIAGKPASTLLHLGPGLANGLANLHNARRAHSPIVNIVGDHATYHHDCDAPLESDIELLAEWLHSPLHHPQSPHQIGAAVAGAIADAGRGRVATVLLPADVSWSAAYTPPASPTPAARLDNQDVECRPEPEELETVLRELKTHAECATLLLGGSATTLKGLAAAQRIAEAFGTRVLVETFPARAEHGLGAPYFERLGYLPEQVRHQFSGMTHLVLVGARRPVTFFAYPGQPNDLVPATAKVLTLSQPEGPESVWALQELAKTLDSADVVVAPPQLPADPIDPGPLTALNWAAVIARLLPTAAIISDESNTSGLVLPMETARSPRHDVLTLTGGAIGQGLPVAIGAAVAAPDRPVIALESDGSALYTITALWTMAREQLNITTIILNNRAYAILQLEMHRVGATQSGSKSRRLLELDCPSIDFVATALGMGVPASRASTVEELAEKFRAATSEPGPHLIEAVLAPM